MFIKFFILIFILFSSVNSDSFTNHRIVKLEESIKKISNDNDSLKMDNKALKTEIENLNKQNTEHFEFYKESLTNNEKVNSNTMDFLFKIISSIFVVTLSIFALVGWVLKSALTKWLSAQIKNGIHEKVNEKSVSEILQNVKQSVVNDARREMSEISNNLQEVLNEHEHRLNKHGNIIEQLNEIDPQNISKSQRALVNQEAKQAENKTKKDEEDWFAIALKEGSEQNYPKAIYAYNKVLQINPQNIAALQNIGLAYNKQMLPNLAENYFLDSLEIDPNNTRTYFLLAEMYQKMKKDIPQAKYYYEKAIETNASNIFHVLSSTSYAELLEEEGQIEKADHYFLEAIKYNPEDAYVYNRYASFLLRQDADNEKINKCFMTSISLSPAYSYALLNYANFLWEKLDKPDEANEYFIKAVEAEPDNVFVLADYADYLFSIEDETNAKSYYERAVNIEPERVIYRMGYKKLFENE